MQLFEIAKAESRKARLGIMDCLTSVISDTATVMLFR